MPDIAVVVGVFHAVENLLHCIELVRTKHHETLVALMQHNILANDFA